MSTRRAAPNPASPPPARGVYYDDFDRRTDIVRVFRLYDSDESAKIDEREFRTLIRDLFALQRQSTEFRADEDAFLDECTRSIASLIPSIAGCKIDLGEFMEAALATPSPFNHFPNAATMHGGGLQATLLSFFNKKNEAVLARIHPFVPTWELQVLEWWQGSVPKGYVPPRVTLLPRRLRSFVTSSPPSVAGATRCSTSVPAT